MLIKNSLETSANAASAGITSSDVTIASTSLDVTFFFGKCFLDLV